MAWFFRFQAEGRFMSWPEQYLPDHTFLHHFEIELGREICSSLSVYWSDKDWFWSWNSSTLATWCEELTHLKRPWCWERLRAGAEGDNRGWDCWMASLTQWTWAWVNSQMWWWTGKPGMLQSMGSQSQTRLSDWTEQLWVVYIFKLFSSDHLVSQHILKLTTKELQVTKIMIATIYLARHQSFT